MTRAFSGTFTGNRGGTGGSRIPGSPALPPKGAQDIPCVNCGIKGHAAKDCRKPRVEREDRPCFNCGEKGHESKNCKKPKAQARIAEAPQPGQVHMVDNAKPMYALTLYNTDNKYESAAKMCGRPADRQGSVGFK